MHKTTFFSTEYNKYMFSFNKKYILLSHPVFEYLFNSDQDKKNDLDNQLNTLTKERNINREIYSNSEYDYYKRKYEMLKKADYFLEKNCDSFVDGLISHQDINFELCNLRALVFEVTERCNLSCAYCFYGDHYKQYEERHDKDFNIEDAKIVLDYMKEKWTSEYNESIGKEIYIGFYGGEPLLNFDFVKELVNYIKTIQQQTKLKFRFNMTTNAVLLDKYMDFLVNNNFSLTISLDGDKKNNCYRTFPNKKSSFDVVLKNIKALIKTHSAYFKESVMFNAVLHDKNDLIDVQNFTRNKFNKSIRCTEVNPLLVGNSFLYKGRFFNLDKSEDMHCFLESSDANNYNLFLQNYSKFHFEDFNDLYNYDLIKVFIPTGTCVPFSRRMFINAHGKILPCETIGHEFSIGDIVNGEINIDTKSIADKYNSYFIKIRKRCKTCYKINFCGQCLLLQIIKDDGTMKCNKIEHDMHHKLLEQYYSIIEKHPELYLKIWEEIHYV